MLLRMIRLYELKNDDLNLAKYEYLKNKKEKIFTDEFSFQALFMILQKKSNEKEIRKIIKKLPKSEYLFLFEGNKIYKVKDKEERYDILLFGYHRVGYKILKTLKDMKVSFAVVDYNPKVVIALSKERINTIYGDAGDKNFLSEIPLDKAKLVISTIPELGINITLKEALKEKSSHAVFLATAEQPRMAGDLYNFGVDYVIVPHHLGGDYVANIIKKFGTNKNSYLSLGKKHHIELNKSKKDSGFNS